MIKEYQSSDDLSELYADMENARINWQNKVISGEYNPEKENPLDENYEKGTFLAWKKAIYAFSNAYIKKFTKDQ